MIERFNIALAILGLYPDADSARDFIVMDDGYGNQRIAEWHIDAPIPTQEELREGYKKYLEAEAKKPRSISTIRELRLEKDLAIAEMTLASVGRGTFTKDSSTVASWLRLIKQEIVTVEDVPDFYNLREVVSKFIEEDGLWSV
ncbi:XkdW family protein [Paenibacillus larvae]